MDGIIVHLTTSTIWQCVLFLLRCIKSFPVYHWKRVLVLGPGFWVHLSERAVNCFGFLDVGGTFDRKDFLTVTLERCKIVFPLFTRVSFNRSTSNLTKALLYSNSCKSTIKNDRHFRFTRIHLARYRVVPLLGNKTLKSFKESVCVSRDNFQVLRQNCNSVSLHDTTWDKITKVLYSYRPNLHFLCFIITVKGDLTLDLQRCNRTQKTRKRNEYHYF